jgi:hypothetical protein
VLAGAAVQPVLLAGYPALLDRRTGPFGPPAMVANSRPRLAIRAREAIIPVLIRYTATFVVPQGFSALFIRYTVMGV